MNRFGPWIMAGVAALVLAVIAYPILRTQYPKDEPPTMEVAEMDPPARVDAAVAMPPRCSVGAAGTSIGAKGETIEIGEAIVTSNGAAVGVRHAPKGTASIAMVANAPSYAVTTIDLASADPDAPPPKLARDGDRLFAASFAKIAPIKLASLPGMPTASSAIRVQRIDGTQPTTIAEVPHISDESLAFDFAIDAHGGMLVYEEDDPLRRWGVIDVTPLDASLHSAKNAIAASPDGTDAEMPRVLLHDDGATIAWIATKNEGGDAAPDYAAQIEGPAERRAYRWIEAVEIDRAGATTGAVRRITSLTGHMGAFVLMRPSAPRDARSFDVIARDDDQPRDGAGSRIVRIVVDAKKIAPPEVIVPDGVGAGALNPIAAAPSANWLAYVDISDHACLVPLTKMPESSVEPALDRATPFASIGTNAIAAFFAEGAEVRVLSCKESQ